MIIRIELHESLLRLLTTVGRLEATDCQKPSPYNQTDVYNSRNGNCEFEAKRWQHPMVLNLHHAGMSPETGAHCYEEGSFRGGLK